MAFPIGYSDGRRKQFRTRSENLASRYHRNGQYSITALTSGSGTILERYAYSAYGEPTFMDANDTVQSGSSEDNRYTYTGREYDEALDLYHYRARMYDATAGRFCSRDPIGYEDGPGLYHACFVPNMIDPSGTKACRNWKCAAYGAAVAAHVGATTVACTTCLIPGEGAGVGDVAQCAACLGLIGTAFPLIDAAQDACDSGPGSKLDQVEERMKRLEEKVDEMMERLRGVSNRQP